MKSSPSRANGRCPHRASTATCCLVALLGPLFAPADARAGGRGWQEERDADQAWTSLRTPVVMPAASPLPARVFRTPRATAVMGIRG